VATALSFEPVVTASEEEAMELLETGKFTLIAVSGGSGGAWQRLRDAAVRKQPMARVLQLPEPNGGDNAELVRRLLLRYLDVPAARPPRRYSTEERYRFLASVLESFTSTLDTKELIRRIVTVARQGFGSEHAWLVHPIHEEMEFTRAIFSDDVSGCAHGIGDQGPLPLERSSGLVRRAMESPCPVVVQENDPDLDPELARRYGVRSEMVQILRPRDGEPWAFGIHHCSAPHEWTEEEIDLFGDIGRYATLALSTALLHERAAREVAKVSAILDQIPESAAIYDSAGQLERMNASAQKEPAQFFSSDPEGRLHASRHRYVDGSPLSQSELPSMRALRGEAVKSDYLLHDVRTGDDRVVNLKAAPIRDDHGRIIGSVVLSRDVTEERQNAEREAWRRRRADCLANLGLDAISVMPTFDTLDDPAKRVAQAVVGTVQIYLYQSTGNLHLVGFATTDSQIERFRQYFESHPYRPGDGLAGTVFQIGRPLFFYEIRGNAVIDFGRDEEERAVKGALHEQSLIACPIESYGERIGAIIVSQSDARRNFDAEDLEFVQSVAERIGAASHIHRLTRISQEGHRAAEELARREVDARVRFEAVLETAPVGVAVISADELRFELANVRWLEFASTFGKIAIDTKVIGLRVAEVIPGWEQTLKQVAESGETRIDQAYDIGSPSEPIYVNRIISAVRGRFTGVTQSLTVLIQDVTEQVKARQEIEALAQMMAERSARLDSILGSMTDGLWVYDAGGKVVDVNQAALTMFGLGSRTEAIANSSFEAFHLRYPDGRRIPTNDLPYARALRGSTVPDYLAMGRNVLTGKDIDISVAAAPIESNGIVGAVLVIRDITALQELDRKKDEFLSVASHELRTPLTTIKGYTQLLSQTVNELPPSDREQYLNAVLGEIDRMMGLISELLDVSRIETNRLQIERQQIAWLQFLERRANAFRVQNPARTIRFNPDAPEITLLVDPDRMRQVVDNLLSNAIKYSPESSEIEMHVTIDGGTVLTSVVDHGIGIPKDEIPKLFERFHRARNVSSRYYGGLGLGLYIAKAIIEAHKGSVHVESEEGKGAKFTLRLPLP
jgi:PAS domain S-box-containing protein